MTMNPADEAAENYKNEMDKLRAEVILILIVFHPQHLFIPRHCYLIC